MHKSELFMFHTANSAARRGRQQAEVTSIVVQKNISRYKQIKFLKESLICLQ